MKRALFEPEAFPGDFRFSHQVGRVKLIRRGHWNHWVCRKDPDDGQRFIIPPALLHPIPEEKQPSTVPTNS